MPPLAKKSKPQPKPTEFASLPLCCTSFGGQAEIDVLVDGRWITAATVNAIEGFDAEDIAIAIIGALKALK